MPSHLYIANTHSKFENLFEEVGKALIQALACGAEQHKIRALSITLHSEESWKQFDLSILWDRSFCWDTSEEGSTSILEFNEAKQESRWGFIIGERRKDWASDLDEKKEEMYAAGVWSFEDRKPAPPNFVLSWICLMLWDEATSDDAFKGFQDQIIKLLTSVSDKGWWNSPNIPYYFAKACTKQKD